MSITWVGNVKNIFFMDIFVFDIKSIKIHSRSYNTIYRGPTPMYITKRNTKMSREAAIIENTFWAVLRPLEVNLTRKYPSDIYKSIVL